eukprot:scaffold1892_cov47-Attheya_sp.AAC.2
MAFLDELGNQVEVRGFRWLRARGVANIMHAIGKMNLKNHSTSRILFSQVEKHAEWLVQEGDPQQIANTVWACATLEIESPILFSQVEKHAKWFVQESNSQGIANTVWAFATLGVASPILFSQVETHAKLFVQEGTPQDIANTVWACTKLGIESPILFSHVEKQAEWLVQEGNPRDVSITVLAFATVGIDSPNLFTCIDVHREKLLQNGNDQDWCNTCYAIAVMDVGKIHSKLLVDMWSRVLKGNVSSLNTEYLMQLAQVEAFTKADGIELEEPSSKLRQRMWSIKIKDHNTASRSQKLISGMLTELGFIHENEVPPLEKWSMGDMLAIDMACPKQKIAIEFDGPSHYLKEVGTGDVTRVENGATKAKRRFLERVGWKVINLNYQDWIEANCTESKGRLWLKEILSNAGIK